MKKIINILFNDFTNDNRVFKESQTLIIGGYNVELVATRFDRKNPIDEDIKEIKVHRVSVGSFNFLPLNLFLFWFKVVRLYKKETIFHCNDLYALPPAFFIKKFINSDIKIVYDCHEHETEAGIYIGKPILKWFAKVIEKVMIKLVDKVITVSESIANDYVKLYEIEKPQLVMNCPNYKKYKSLNIFREKLNIGKDKIIFLYQGEYLKGRGVDSLIEIFKVLQRENENLVLILLVYGEGIESLKEKIKGITNIFWHDKVSKDIYMDYVASCDWGIYLMENICKNHDYALPNKLFDYIMAGLPVVVSNLKEMSKFVDENHVGYTVDSTNPENIVKLLKGFKNTSKEEFNENLKIVSKKYCWEEQEKVLLKIYNSL